MVGRRPNKILFTMSKKRTSTTMATDKSFPTIFFMEKCIQFDPDNFCRCCLASTNAVHGIAPMTPIKVEIFRTMSLVIPKSDEQLKICKSCKQDLDAAYKFRKMCQRADQRYQQILSEKEPIMEPLFEVSVKEEPLVDEDGETSRIAVAFVDLKKYEDTSNVKKEPAESMDTDDDSNRAPSSPLSPESDGDSNLAPSPLQSHETKTTEDDVFTDPKTGKKLRKKLQCTLCFKYFASLPSFNFHKDVHRDKSERYICHQCGRSFKFRTSLMKHFRETKNFPNHTKEGVYACLRCPKRYHLLKDLHVHMTNFHEIRDLMEFKCKFEGCDAIFAQELLLFEHSFSHTPGVFPFNCQDHAIEDCDYKTVKKDSFRKHLRGKHRILFEEKIHGWKRNEQPEPEPIENPQIKIKSRYSMRFEPTQEVTALMCRYCSKVYECASGLQYHERAVHENMRYFCEAQGCYSVFTTKMSWSDHQWTHRGRMPFECVKFFPDCDFKCRLQTSFKLHLLNAHKTAYCQSIHGYSESAEEIMARKNLKKKPWDPEEHKRKQLAMNTRFHLPYQCNMCDMGFAKDMALRYHVRKIHTLQAIFQCKICPYNTTVKRIIFEHSFEHLGKTAWNCPHCDYKGNRQLKFKYHLKENHNVSYTDKEHGYSRERIQQIVDEYTVTEVQDRLAKLSRTEVGGSQLE